MEALYDLLFEISSGYRCEILFMLSKGPIRVTEIAKRQKFTTQEISRNLSRLNEVGLTYKDLDGFYHLSPLGEVTITLLREFEFISQHKNYFVNHRVNHLPQEFLKSLDNLSGSHESKSLADFLHQIDVLIRESTGFVNLAFDQFPLMLLGSIMDATKRGVKVSILESKGTASDQRMNFNSSDDSDVVEAGLKSLIVQRTTNSIGVFLIFSNVKCAVAFPTREGSFDYTGFVSSDTKSMRWCDDLFMHFWDIEKEIINEIEESSIDQKPLVELQSGRLSKIIVEGKNGEDDAQAVQNAVENYQEVVLKGTFDFSKQAVIVDKSVVIRGEGRENGFPSTKIHKKGWVFPPTGYDSIIKIEGSNAEVVIENIHFTDFNCSCIRALQGKKLRIRNNAITLQSGYKRGCKFEHIKEMVTGIWIEGPSENLETNSFGDGVLIEKNYIDFALQPKLDFPSLKSRSQNLSDASNDESYAGFGINIRNLSGKISIIGNTIVNMNGKGISVSDHLPTSVVSIKQNFIKSEIPGSYLYPGDDAGFGIFSQCSLRLRKLGFKVEIENNIIQLLKSDYCGISVIELSLGGKSSHFMTGMVSNNQIYLLDGTSGLRIGSKNLKLKGNKIMGSAYYGLQTSGFRSEKKQGEGGTKPGTNDISELTVRPLDFWRFRKRAFD